MKQDVAFLWFRIFTSFSLPIHFRAKELLLVSRYIRREGNKLSEGISLPDIVQSFGKIILLQISALLLSEC